MTVSPTAALLVLVAFLAYHAVETDILIPRIYGRHPDLSKNCKSCTQTSQDW